MLDDVLTVGIFMMLVIMVKMKMNPWYFSGTYFAGSLGFLLENDGDGDKDDWTWSFFD